VLQQGNLTLRERMGGESLASYNCLKRKLIGGREEDDDKGRMQVLAFVLKAVS